MKILGVSCYYHDSAACLVKNGSVVAACEEEKFSRKKHDSEFPSKAISYCLKEGGLRPKELDYVVFYEKPFLKLERLLLTNFQTYPKSFELFYKSVTTWFLNKLWVKSHISDKLNFPSEKILFLPHHLSHAASCYLPSGFSEAAILTNDGVGEWSSSTYGVGKGDEIRVMKEMIFPHSLGLLYATLTAFLGFEVNEGEYKVMGMAGFGKPRFTGKIKRLFRLFPDGSIQLDLDYFSYTYNTEKMFTEKLVELLGIPRLPGFPFFTSKMKYPTYYEKKGLDLEKEARQNQYYADIAASLQSVTEEIILTQVRHLYKETGLSNLCLAGGVALNGLANGRIVNETPFEHLFVQPAAGDSGGAMGAALYAASVYFKEERFVLKSAYLGPEFSEREVTRALKYNGITKYKKMSNKDLTEIVVSELTKGKVVGWFQGRLEWGPRALGNRSILGDPRNKKMKDLINVKVKFREPFRPFAPVVIAEKASEYFDLPDVVNSQPAKFMTIVCGVKKGKKKDIAAGVHIDGTGRLQVIDRKTNPRYYDLVKKFGEKTGVYVLINTSFNLKGEPIVCSPNDAISTFKRSGIDDLVLGNFLIKKVW